MTELSFREVSNRTKAGLKGPGAAAWLAEQRIAVPPAPNEWLDLGAAAVIARLAETEFFLEDATAAGPAAALLPLLEQPPAGVYSVPRQDTCFVLSGHTLHEVLVQVCSVDFRSLAKQNALFMTSMAGVSVLAIPEQLDGAPSLRIWVDPTFGPYLHRTLSTIVEEIRGGPK